MVKSINLGNDYCRECGEKLPEVKIKRYMKRYCNDCRSTGNSSLRDIYKDMQMKKKVRTEEDEGIMFEDDPRAKYEDNAIYRRRKYE
tara:strand:+ start:315 stop:575 length:261 start_codon:yes stop_codon:yes gene_type:complete